MNITQIRIQYNLDIKILTIVRLAVWITNEIFLFCILVN